MIKFFMAVIITEALTEIVVKSELLFPFRSYVFNRGKSNSFFTWIHSLVDCGYCFSVWMGWLTAFLLFGNNFVLIHTYVDWFFIGLVIHRLSNIFHFLIDRLHGLDR